MKKFSNEEFVYWLNEYYKERGVYPCPHEDPKDAMLWLIENDYQNHKRMKVINKIINEYFNIVIYGQKSSKPYPFTIEHKMPDEISTKIIEIYHKEYEKQYNSSKKSRDAKIQTIINRLD